MPYVLTIFIHDTKEKRAIHQQEHDSPTLTHLLYSISPYIRLIFRYYTAIMNIQIKRLFGPIRRFIQVQPEQYIYAVETSGFTKSMLDVKIALNNVVWIDGKRDIYEKGVLIHRCHMHEAIHLPLGTKLESFRWETEYGLTILRCSTKPSNFDR